jgi:hypothetical protein
VRRTLWLICLVAAALAAPALARAHVEPVAWCGGSDETAADRAPDLEAAAPDQVRFVYAVPSGEQDHFADFASGIATDAAWIDQWWQTQDPTRTPRFDRYPFPNCTSRFGALDIGVKRLALPRSTYLFADTPGVELDSELRGAFPPDEKTIVYFDGPIKSRTVCGETDYLANTRGGDNGIVYVYLQSNCNLGVPGAGRTAEVAGHELLHNLGAVPDGAPNECPASQSHVCDSSTDIMYPFVTDGSTLDSVLLDVNHDDYYAHAGAWFDVQDSSWLTNLPQFPFSLSLTGSGKLSSALPCDVGCAGLQLDNGESVSLRAVPSRGWKFASWSGACSGTSPDCTFRVGGPTNATATFVKVPLRVVVAVKGAGRVTSSPAGIACPGSACAKTFTALPARLTPHPAPGWRFTGWSGACTGRGACVLDAAGTARARFARR